MSRTFRSLSLLFPALVLGCNRPAPRAEDAGPPEVMVSVPVKEHVVEYQVFNGRTEAISRVDLRARVTGYLDKIYVGRDADAGDGVKVIPEGGDVKKGDVLFVIQQKPFRDALTQAEGSLEQLKVQRDFNKRDLERTRASGAGISPADLDRADTAVRTSERQVQQAAAAVEIAKQNLEWTTIRAPFDGRIGRRFVDRGTDVKAEDTVLAAIEQTDPLYAHFDVDERTALRIGGLLQDGKVPPDAARKFPLTLGLANERPEDFAHPGTLDFADNKVDPGTGTLRMWGVFANPRHDLKSGMFARVRMGIGEPRESLFVAETALNSDQGHKYVDVVDANNQVVYTPVEVGQRKDGLVAVRGLKETDRVIVEGLQRVVGKGAVVVPKEVPMPRTDAEIRD
jgi:multidrug efflux system membrane fusion protein